MTDRNDNRRASGQQGRSSQPTRRRVGQRPRQGSSRQSQVGQVRATVPKGPTRQEILRNRIIAAVVLIVIIFLLVNLVTCVAHGIGGSQGRAAPEVAVSASGASEASSLVATVNDRASQQAAATVPADQGVEDPWVPGGRFTTGDAELDQMVKDWCDSNSRDDLNAADNAFNAYCGAMWAEFVERDDNQYPTGPTWDITYAKQGLSGNGVNCYEQVAVGEYILKYFGYAEAYAEPCFILRQSGEYGDHGLLYVTDMDGRKCLCDPAFGANGWMLDADVYTVKLMDVGQDPSEFTIAPFEEVVPAPWM